MIFMEPMAQRMSFSIIVVYNLLKTLCRLCHLGAVYASPSLIGDLMKAS